MKFGVVELDGFLELFQNGKQKAFNLKNEF